MWKRPKIAAPTQDSEQTSTLDLQQKTWKKVQGLSQEFSIYACLFLTAN